MRSKDNEATVEVIVRTKNKRGVLPNGTFATETRDMSQFFAGPRECKTMH